MSDPRSVPRRMSLGYILGFSDKPFKDAKAALPPPSPPRPRKPSQLAELISSPAGLMEWSASDGRKGKITKMAKPQLTAATLAKVPSNTRSTKDTLGAKEASKKPTSNKSAPHIENQWSSGDWNVSGSNKGSQKAASDVADARDIGNVGDTWTPQADFGGGETKKDEKDQKKEVEDKKKEDDNNNNKNAKPTEQVTKAGIPNETLGADSTTADKGDAKKVGKPATSKSGDMKNNTGKENAGKKDKAKHDDQKQGENVKENKTAEDKKGNEDIADTWGGGIAGLMGDANGDKPEETGNAKDENTWNNEDTSWAWNTTNIGDTGNVKDSADICGTWDGAGDTKNQDITNSWGASGGDVLAVSWDTPNQQTNNITNGGVQVPQAEEWPTAAKPASASHSNKAPSESRSHRSTASKSKSKSNTNRAIEIELEPDDTFSADDLRLIARILQQDCSMVWNRLSWRFRDKTGRTLHPDLFEKKITGTVDGKEKGDGGVEQKK